MVFPPAQVSADAKPRRAASPAQSAKYWYFSDGKVLGPLETKALKEIAEFTSSLLVCPENKEGIDAEDWRPACEYTDLVEAPPKLESAKNHPVQAEGTASAPDLKEF